MVLIADRRSVDLYGNDFIAMTLPGDPADKLYIRGTSPAELGANLRPRIESVATRLGFEFSLSDDFETSLAATIQRFNGFAEVGRDDDFGRGETDYEKQWHFAFSDKPNT